MVRLKLCALAVAVTLTTAPAASAEPVRTLLFDGGSGYPRVIRLADGTILASVGSKIDGSSVGLIHESTDDGASFHRLAVISDPDGANGRGMCCGSLFELPVAVGALPAGAVLWATTSGTDVLPATEKHVRQRLWRSDDHGRSWSYLSDIAVSPNQYNAWEPELSVSADGRLVAFWSDESDKGAHDQKLVQASSVDGVTWTPPRDTVVDGRRTVRPGMIGVRRLPDGAYFMVYEVCNNDLVHLCGIYARTSSDGWDYGDPADLGTQIRSSAGAHPRHTPTLAWAPGPGANGRLLLISEMLVDEDGSLSTGNGGTILVTDLGEENGEWREMPAPIVVTGVNNDGCRNFSPSLLPSRDGESVLELATDVDNGVCKTYFATGPITG